MSRTVLIIQARMESSRLPDKTLMDLAGAPLLGRILERVKRVRGVDAIVVATTQNFEDAPVAQIAKEYGVESFRGSENDLVDRYYQAAKAFHAYTVLPLPAVNPCPEPEAFERLIESHRQSGADFLSNIMQVNNNRWPEGIGVEAFGYEVFEAVWRTVNDRHGREHLATNFYDYLNQRPAQHSRFKIGTVECPESWRRPDLVLDVNTPDEFSFLRQLYEDLYPRNSAFHTTEIIDWYNEATHRNEQENSR
jgi:spore coat polysaccharide biosynthesis protein SpsF